MKNGDKFLHYANKLEELQTARKAKEVDEVRKIAMQGEVRACREHRRLLDYEQQHRALRKQTLDDLLVPEQERRKRASEELESAELFENEARHVLIHGPGNDFDVIAEIQGEIVEEGTEKIKQLPAGEPGMFNHELADLADAHLQEELERNQEEITRGQEPAPVKESPELDDAPQTDAPSPDTQTSSETQEEPPSASQPSSGNVFFFRSQPPRKK